MRIAIIDLLGLTYDGSTLSKQGLGGSESAVILMSKELAKLGYEVTVYNNCEFPGVYDGVRYIDHSTALPDTYDIVISSRSVKPFMAGNQYVVKVMAAKHRVLWMHDTFCEGDEYLEAMVVNGFIHEVFTLSDFHTSYVGNANHGHRRMFEVLKHKIFQTRNGAVRYDVDSNIEQKIHSQFVYNASATKGLIPLVEKVWPRVKKAIPEATLTCIGGYYNMRDGQLDAQGQKVHELMQSDHLKELGVSFTGVITQQHIAEILAKSSFMIYPTAFPETFGISSLESLLYNTPIITNTFGALEETAVDLACYKLPYCVTPNNVYPTIDEDRQCEMFASMVIDAYHNKYLYQQKATYCDVVKDIAGWDTIALQWDQHFHSVFKIPYPVESYRKVSQINSKVARVFGRRFDNAEDRKVYTSYGLQRRIVVISPYRNANDYIHKHVASVQQQDYDNFVHILIDDASNTRDEISGRNVVPLYNNKRLGCIQNQLRAIGDFVEDDDIVMFLDGDDWLVNNNSIFHYYNDLYSQGYDYTYGSMWSVADNIPLVAQEWRPDRKYPWNIPYTHLRTMIGSIAKKVDWNNYKVDGKWMMAGADNPFFKETISYAKKPIAVKEIMVNYNDANPLNDYKVNSEEQNRNAAMVRTKKKILIGVPTNKYVETATMKSIYDLTIPDGYETELQFFYGYQIDQIRNLIADWAKNYDYLLSVDSDIVLPKDALVKMLAADKDIISGLYIQRIPNTHTLEIYRNGKNVPIEQLGSGIVEIDGCGFGCCLIKGRVFRDLVYPHFVYKSAINHINTVSEDVYFCSKAKARGFKVWADTSIQCDHVGTSVFRVVAPTVFKTRLETLSEQDLLPQDHANYLKTMDAKPKVVYDIGASLMHWTKKAKEVWPDAEYVLIDAAQSVRPILEKSGHKFAQAVLTDEDGKRIEFYEDVDNPGGNSYYKETTGAFNESHKRIMVGATLDSLITMNDWPLPDLIKLDVQGAELDILKGATKSLTNCTDIILEAQHVNYNDGAPKVNDVLEYMESIGYKLVSNFCHGGVDGDYHFKKV